jgi:hypothetical protein
MAYYPQYYADHNGKHEIFKDMPTPCNDLESFNKVRELIKDNRPIRNFSTRETHFDGVYEKAFNESNIRKTGIGGIKEILSVPAESFSDAKVVNANEESHSLTGLRKKLDALSQKT